MPVVKMLHRTKRQLVVRLCTLIWIVTTAVMLWKGLMVVSRSESPIVVMLR
jgi:sulfite exporter TauE/SafE